VVIDFAFNQVLIVAPQGHFTTVGTRNLGLGHIHAENGLIQQTHGGHLKQRGIGTAGRHFRVPQPQNSFEMRAFFRSGFAKPRSQFGHLAENLLGNGQIGKGDGIGPQETFASAAAVQQNHRVAVLFVGFAGRRVEFAFSIAGRFQMWVFHELETAGHVCAGFEVFQAFPDIRFRSAVQSGSLASSAIWLHLAA